MMRLFTRRRPTPAVLAAPRLAPGPVRIEAPAAPAAAVLVADQPPAAPLVRARRTEYVVTYGPVGIPGNTYGRPTPASHTVHALGRQGLAEAIRRHVAPYLNTRDVFVVADLDVLGGQLMVAGRKAGLFNLQIIPPAEGDVR